MQAVQENRGTRYEVAGFTFTPNGILWLSDIVYNTTEIQGAISAGYLRDATEIETTVIQPTQWITKKGYICLTFDGSYGDWTDVYLPILNSYNVLATFFVQTANIGGGTYNSGANRYIEWANLRELYQGGHEIACHTINHPDFNQMYLNVIDEHPLISHSQHQHQFVPKDSGRMYAFMFYPKPVYARNSQYATEDYRRLKYLTVWLRRSVGTLTGTLHAEIWSVSAGKPNVQLGTDSVSVDATAIAENDYAKITFTFTTAIPDADIEYGNAYFGVIDLGSLAGTASLYIASSDIQRIGEVGRSVDAGVSWTMTDYDTTHKAPYYVIEPVTSVEAELRDAKRLIEDNIQSADSTYRCKGFAYPFDDMSSGREAHDMVSRYFEYARNACLAKDFDIQTNYPPEIDFHNLAAMGLDTWMTPTTEIEQREYTRMAINQLKKHGGIWVVFGHATYTPGPTAELEASKLEYFLNEVSLDTDIQFVTMSQAVDILRTQTRKLLVKHQPQLSPENREVMFETHFLEPAAALASTQIAKHYWTTIKGGTATATAEIAPDGTMKLITGASSGENITLLYTHAHFNTNDGLIMETKVRFNGGWATMNTRIGLYISGGADYAYFDIQTPVNGDDIFLATGNNSVNATPTTTKFEFTQDQWYIFRLDLTDTHRPRFFINGFDVTREHLGTNKKNIALRPYFYIHPTSTNVRIMDIAYCKVWRQHQTHVDFIS